MAGPVILLEPLPPPDFHFARIKTALNKALKEEGAILKKELQKTTRTWNDKPSFSVSAIVTRQQVGVMVGPNLRKESGMHWLYLDGGTKIRWALMSGDWRSKTRSGWLGSGRGRGRVLFVGKKAFGKAGLKARPGIKARHWTVAVLQRRAPKFIQRLDREFTLWAKG